MSLSTNLVSGLSSGFDWRSMIDQLIAVEHRRVDLVENQKTDYETKLEIFQSINTKLLSFKTQAETLSSSNAFNVFTSSLSTDSANYSASSFLSVSTSTSAAPVIHTITMNSNSSMAQARTLSSKSFTTYNTDLDLVGEFIINGRAVKVETSDDLLDIRDKINNLDSGINATGVTASILTVSSSNYRLILTSENTGEDAFTIFEASSDTQNILSSGLGLTDGTTSIKNYISNGVQSEAFSSASQSVSSILGITTAQSSATISIGSVNNIELDLSDSLTEIASDINTAVSATNIMASVVSSTEDSVTTYRLKIENTTSFTDDNHVLETLGIRVGDQGNVAEVLVGSVANKRISDGLAIVSGTTFDDITGFSGDPTGQGDTITITGTKHDGTPVSGTFSIYDSGYKNVNDLLTYIEDTVFGNGTVNAYISDGNDGNTAGQLVLEDIVAGDSQLSLTLVANNQGGGTLNFGTVSASTEGYTMETQAGLDANIIIDGTAVTSSSNIIDDVIAGVTLNLLTVEDLEGADTTTVTINVSRDNNAIKSTVQGLLDEYNDVILAINDQFYYDEETQTAGLLQGDSTLNSIKSSLQSIVVSSITGLSSTMNALSLIGITSQVDYSNHKNDGKLSIDDDIFTDALEDNFSSLRRIFVAEGSTTDGDVEYINHNNDTVAGNYLVNITTVATQTTVTGTEDLFGGIGASDIETLTITQGSKIGAITLDGATGENGSSIDNIVNAINSELDAEYAQSVMGNVKNTLSDMTTAISNTTTWNLIYSSSEGGDGAGLADNDQITFTGHRSNGTEASGTYAISNVEQDTVQGLLSAIESAYNYEVSAAINTNGHLVVTDNTNGNSNLDIIINEPEGETKKLDFGYVTTSNLVGSQRNTTDGSTAIEVTTKWQDINGSDLINNDTIKFTGYTVDGTAVEGNHQVTDIVNQDVDDLLTAIEDAFNAKDGASVTAEIQDGRIVVKDGTTNSTLDLTIFEPAARTLDFGTFSGGVTGRYSIGVTASKDGSDHLVLTHDDYGSGATFSVGQSGSDLGLGSITEGVDVVGKINGEDATGSGQVLTGDAPATGETTSVEELTIKYTGTETGAQGYVKITMGIGELFDRVLYNITNAADGYLDYRIESMGDRIDDYEAQIEELEARLDRKMEMMINRFVAMELALSKIQNQSNWLTGQINASYSGWAGW